MSGSIAQESVKNVTKSDVESARIDRLSSIPLSGHGRLPAAAGGTCAVDRLRRHQPDGCARRGGACLSGRRRRARSVSTSPARTCWRGRSSTARRSIVFVSADEAQMKLIEAAGAIAPGTRVDLLGNKLAVVLSSSAPAVKDAEAARRNLVSDGSRLAIRPRFRPASTRGSISSRPVVGTAASRRSCRRPTCAPR